jgi:hypothetical protein
MPSEAVTKVLSRLWALDCDAKGSEQHGWNAKCPAHEDRSPSLKLDQGNDGRALIFCHAGCTLEALTAAMGLEMGELFEAEPAPIPERVVIERYDYVDENDTLLFQVERMRPKAFRQRRPNGHGGWEYQLGNTRRVLYRLPKVIEAVNAGEIICVVEGERDVHTLEGKGKVATTCPGGAGKWRDQYSETLRGAKVAIIQDADPVDPKTGKRPGQDHALQVRAALDGVAVAVKVFQPAIGKDVTDHVKGGLPLSELVDVTDGEPARPKMEVLTAREIMALPDPDEEGYLLGPLLYRGHRIVIGGWTGHGKTTFTMHMVACAVEGREFLRPKWKGRKDREINALVVDVEQGTRTVKRVLREVGLDRSDHVKYLRVPDGLGLDSDQEAITFMEKTFAQGGFDLVLCDPLYKCHRGDPNDTRAAAELMRRFDDWRDRYQFALILPMHCRKPQNQHGAPKLSPHDLFGSSAYQWGAEMLLGVERKSPGMTWVHWWKDREGDAAEDGATVGNHWPVHFDRKRGFQRYVEGNQERLPTFDATPRFSLREYVYQAVRDHGPQTCAQIRDSLYHQRKIGYAHSKIYEALDELGDRGIVCRQPTKLKKTWTYELQPELLSETACP